MTKINHIAVVVSDMDAALHFWRDALGLTASETEYNADEGAALVFLPVGESQIELVQPTTADSGLARYLDKRGPGLHHVCIDVDDLDAAIERLRAANIDLINETPRTRPDGTTRYIFVHPRSTGGVLLELYETRSA